MAPRGKSVRQSKIRSVSNSEPPTTAPPEPTPTATSEPIQAENAMNSPQTPSSVSRTYAQAVRSAPPSPRRESTAAFSASTSSHLRVAPSTPSAHTAEAGQGSLEGTSMRVAATANLSTPYELQAATSSSSLNPPPLFRESSGGPPPTSVVHAAGGLPVRHAEEWPAYGTHAGTANGSIAAGPDVVDTVQACAPSPVSANPRPPTRMSANGITAAATPEGEWTLVTGKPLMSAKTKSTAVTAPRTHVTDGRPAVYVDKGKARGPPGPPSPPHPAYRPAPPVSKVPEGPVDWRTAPRDFYHLGTDLAVLKRALPVDARPATTTHEHAPSVARDNTRREDFGYREAKRPRHHSPVREEDPFIPSSKDLERMNAHGPDLPLWAATPEGGQSIAGGTYAHVTDPIARAYEEGLLAGRQQSTPAPHLVPIPDSPETAAGTRETSREHPQTADYAIRRDLRANTSSSAIPSTRASLWPSQMRETRAIALQDITNMPTQHSNPGGNHTASARPYYSARPCDIQARAPTTSAWLQHERGQPPAHTLWRSAVPTSTSSGSHPMRRPPTPHPARPGNSRGLQDYDDLPWLLSPTRRGILSEAAGARASTSDYAGTIGAQSGSNRTYTARLSTLEPYAPQRLVFTPAPEQGWDTIHHNDPEELLASVDREKLPGLLEEDAEGTVMVRIYNLHSASTNQIREVTEYLTLLTREITGETSFKIIPPEATRNDDGPPRHAIPVWSIVRLSREGARELAEGRVFSAPLMTALTSPRSPDLGRFLFNLGGFSHDEDGDIIRTVWETFNGPQILPTITRLARGNPAFNHISPEEAAGVILASLEVQVSTLDNGNLVAAVFCDSPTASLPLWRQWRDGMLGIRFRSLFNSTATARRPSRCAGCHSASHLTHLCPFPMVPGWNAAPPSDRDQMASQRPTAGRSTVQGDPNAPARFGRNPRGRGATANRAAPRRRQPERRGERDGYERNGYDGRDAFGGGSHDGKSGFGRDEYM